MTASLLQKVLFAALGFMGLRPMPLLMLPVMVVAGVLRCRRYDVPRWDTETT